MKGQNARLSLVFVTLVLLANPATSMVDGGSGFVPGKIKQGSEVMFSGTIFNLSNLTIYVHSMYVEFIEGTTIGSTGIAQRFNSSHSYPESRRTLESNASLSDFHKDEINYEPGEYNVTVYFEYANTTTATTFDIAYAIINQTTVVVGVSSAGRLLRGFGIFVGIVASVIIGLIVYNNKFKK